MRRKDSSTHTHPTGNPETCSCTFLESTRRRCMGGCESIHHTRGMPGATSHIARKQERLQIQLTETRLSLFTARRPCSCATHARSCCQRNPVSCHLDPTIALQPARDAVGSVGAQPRASSGALHLEQCRSTDGRGQACGRVHSKHRLPALNPRSSRAALPTTILTT